MAVRYEAESGIGALFSCVECYQCGKKSNSRSMECLTERDAKNSGWEEMPLTGRWKCPTCVSNPVFHAGGGSCK